MSNERLQVRDLHKSYGSFKAVDGISFVLQPGDLCGLVGPNGAGKSTTIRSILRLLPYEKGEILLDGRKIDCTKDYLSQIGYAGSDPAFPEDMKVKDILHFAAGFYMGSDKANQTDTREKGAELCQILDLDPNKKVRELSLGNRKKLAIILALQHSPKILIFDEPASGLDPLAQKTFFDLLRKEQDKGTAILLSSHNLWEVSEYCSKVLFIKDGKLLDTDAFGRDQMENTWKVSARLHDWKQGSHTDEERLPEEVILSDEKLLSERRSHSGEGSHSEKGPHSEAQSVSEKRRVSESHRVSEGKYDSGEKFLFENMPGSVAALQMDHGRISFLFRGNLNELTGYLAGLDLEDLSVSRPDLEEQFLELYQRSKS